MTGSGRKAPPPARASDALETVVVGILAAVRAISVGLLILFVAAWHSWYGEHPTGLAVAAAAGGWGIFFVVACLRWGLGRRLALANAAVVCLLAANAPRSLPDDAIGEPGTWLLLAVSHACVVAAWVLPTGIFVVVAPALSAAFVVGGWQVRPRILVAGLAITAVAACFRVGMAHLRRVVLRADGRIAAATARQRAEVAVLDVARDRRERERLIHDTVLNTLTGIAWGGGQDTTATRQRCAEGVAAVHALFDIRDDDAPVDIHGRLAGVLGAARARGLRVSWSSATSLAQGHRSPLARAGRLLGRGRRRDRREPGAAAAPPGRRRDLVDVPLDVAAAFAAATGEVLADVERRAGAPRARVAMLRTPDLLTIRIVGEGAGGVLAAPDRLVPPEPSGGIQARVADVGGWMALDPDARGGTAVGMTWRAPHRVGEPPGAVQPATAARAAQLRSSYAAGLRGALGAAAVLWHLLLVLPMAATLGHVRAPVAAVAAWLVLGAATWMAARVVRARPLTRLEALGLVAVALVVPAVGGANTREGDVLRVADWSLLAVPLLVAIVAATRPAREWASALVVAASALTAMAVARGGTGHLLLSRLSMLLYALCALAIVVAMLGPLLSKTAETTALAMQAEAELAAGQRARALVMKDRARWLRGVHRDVLPLLRGLAAGQLDPRAPEVQARCARGAATVRRMLARGNAPSLHELGDVVDDAQDRGVDIDLQFSGDLGLVPQAVRAQLARQVRQALGPLAGGRALLTVICSPEGGSALVSYPWSLGAAGPTPSPLPASADLLVAGVDHSDGSYCLELRWDTGPARTAVPG